MTREHQERDFELLSAACKNAIGQRNAASGLKRVMTFCSRPETRCEAAREWCAPPLHHRALVVVFVVVVARAPAPARPAFAALAFSHVLFFPIVLFFLSLRPHLSILLLVPRLLLTSLLSLGRGGSCGGCDSSGGRSSSRASPAPLCHHRRRCLALSSSAPRRALRRLGWGEGHCKCLAAPLCGWRKGASKGRNVGLSGGFVAGRRVPAFAPSLTTDWREKRNDRVRRGKGARH